jgi:hypothetical protein
LRRETSGRAARSGVDTGQLAAAIHAVGEYDQAARDGLAGIWWGRRRDAMARWVERQITTPARILDLLDMIARGERQPPAR